MSMQLRNWIQTFDQSKHNCLYFKGREQTPSELLPGAVNAQVIKLCELCSRTHIKVYQRVFDFYTRTKSYHTQYIFDRRLNVLYAFTKKDQMSK